MIDEPDIGEAVEYILAERPNLTEDDVWAVLVEIRQPPSERADGLALQILARARPEVSKRAAKLILREWRAYAALAAEEDWEDGP